MYGYINGDGEHAFEKCDDATTVVLCVCLIFVVFFSLVLCQYLKILEETIVILTTVSKFIHHVEI